MRHLREVDTGVAFLYTTRCHGCQSLVMLSSPQAASPSAIRHFALAASAFNFTHHYLYVS